MIRIKDRKGFICYQKRSLQSRKFMVNTVSLYSIAVAKRVFSESKPDTLIETSIFSLQSLDLKEVNDTQT
ncbi:MAG: hypothetical protein B6D34_13080 [Candidatus Brocadia sp. UTAMX1]|jgi:hypothetical protein|nr:MAG: hypothetical protein B6D34_13080 [Candidatus Brocadia sp. UTAMX1]